MTHADGYDDACQDMHEGRPERHGDTSQPYWQGYSEAWAAARRFEATRADMGRKFRRGYVWPFDRREKPR